jgi:hypothetical protein
MARVPGGTKSLRFGDWIIRDADGAVSVLDDKAYRQWWEAVPSCPPQGDPALDAAFIEALWRLPDAPQELSVYDSNSYRRVGLKRDHRELVWAYTQRSDGHPDIAGAEYLRAMVAAFNAMLARLPPPPGPSTEALERARKEQGNG